MTISSEIVVSEHAGLCVMKRWCPYDGAVIMMALVGLKAVTPPIAQPSLWLVCKLEIRFMSAHGHLSTS